MNLLAISAVDSTLRESIRLIAPEAVLVATACVLFLLSTFKTARQTAGVVAAAGLALAAIAHVFVLKPGDLVGTVTPLLGDRLEVFIRITALASGAILLMLSWNEPNNNRACDYFGCLLVAIAGVSLVGAANDLIFMYLSLEMISIPTYVMLYLPKNTEKSQEATIKYFLLSLMSSAMLLFGFSYLYGLTGTTNITAILAMLPSAAAGDATGLATIAIVMVIAGLGFRITAFPFHFYAPDVYQGAPVGVVALLSFLPKVAGFAAMLRLFGPMNAGNASDFSFARQYMMLIWILAAVTMTAGNVMALLQNNLRRMLAYSGVAHGGYMLIGIAVLPSQGAADSIVNGGQALLFYLIAYGAMTIGAFAVIAYLSSADRPVQAIDDLAGLRETNPCLAALMAIFLFSMIGLPLSAGFLGKFYLFLSALSVKAGPPMGHLFQALVIVAAVNAAIGAYYYLRVIGVIYLRGSFQPKLPTRCTMALLAAVICAAATVIVGIAPGSLLAAARGAFGGG